MKTKHDTLILLPIKKILNITADKVYYTKCLIVCIKGGPIRASLMRPMMTEILYLLTQLINITPGIMWFA